MIGHLVFRSIVNCAPLLGFGYRNMADSVIHSHPVGLSSRSLATNVPRWRIRPRFATRTHIGIAWGLMLYSGATWPEYPLLVSYGIRGSLPTGVYAGVYGRPPHYIRSTWSVLSGLPFRRHPVLIPFMQATRVLCSSSDVPWCFAPGAIGTSPYTARTDFRHYAIPTKCDPNARSLIPRTGGASLPGYARRLTRMGGSPPLEKTCPRTLPRCAGRLQTYHAAPWLSHLIDLSRLRGPSWALGMRYS